MFEGLSWFYFSVAATILFGISTALYKLPTFKNLSKSSTVFWVLFSGLILSTIVFKNHFKLEYGPVVLFALLWGGSYAILTFLQMYTLKHVETNTLFPTTTISSLVLTVLAGLLLFQDRLSSLQVIGIILVVITVFLFTHKKGKTNYNIQIMLLGIGIVLFSAFNKIIQKYGVDTGDIFNFQIYQYFFGALLALVLMAIAEKKDFASKFFSGAKAGISIGIIAFLGGYSILIALSRGSFPLIQSIHSLYIFVTAIIGSYFFKENLTTKKIILIILAVISALLIKLG